MADNQTPAGWYADPAGDTTKIRYWDGQNWTDQLRDVESPAASAPIPEASVPSPDVSAVVSPDPYNPAPQQQQDYGNQQPLYQQPGYQQPQIQQPQIQQPGYQTPQVAAAGGTDLTGFAIAGLVCGIVGIPLGFFVPIGGVILGVLGILFGIRGRKSSKPTFGTAGLVLGIIALVFSCVAWAVNFAIVMNYL